MPEIENPINILWKITIFLFFLVHLLYNINQKSIRRGEIQCLVNYLENIL